MYFFNKVDRFSFTFKKQFERSTGYIKKIEQAVRDSYAYKKNIYFK